MIKLLTVTDEQLLADIKIRLDRGEVAASVEIIQGIASDTEDATLLRKLVALLSDALVNPKKRKRGRPQKSLVILKDGTIDLDSSPSLTRDERARELQKLLNMACAIETVLKKTQRGVELHSALELAAQERAISVSDLEKHWYEWQHK